MLATPSRCESLLRWVDYARPHSAVNAVLHYFYFRRKNPPATVCWRVRAKMPCNAMQRGIEWRMDKIKDAIQSLRRTLSQSEIARRTGIAQHKISRWESGGIPAGASDALKLIELAKEVAAAAPAQEAAE
jgi:DNA-binding XRE family transcriptional regulator